MAQTVWRVLVAMGLSPQVPVLAALRAEPGFAAMLATARQALGRR